MHGETRMKSIGYVDGSSIGNAVHIHIFPEKRWGHGRNYIYAAPTASEYQAAAPQRDQSDWDEVPKAFNEWWDKDYDGKGNPFSFDSPAYWAWAGWKAAAPQGEPVAYYDRPSDKFVRIKDTPHGVFVYTHPAPAPLKEWEDQYGMKEWQVLALRAGWSPIAPAPLSDEQIEALAVEHEAFGFGRVDAQGLTTHGFDPDGLHKFCRAIERHVRG